MAQYSCRREPCTGEALVSGWLSDRNDIQMGHGLGRKGLWYVGYTVGCGLPIRFGSRTEEFDLSIPGPVLHSKADAWRLPGGAGHDLLKINKMIDGST